MSVAVESHVGRVSVVGTGGFARQGDVVDDDVAVGGKIAAQVDLSVAPGTVCSLGSV